jgi:hypothetical protein
MTKLQRCVLLACSPEWRLAAVLAADIADFDPAIFGLLGITRDQNSAI